MKKHLITLITIVMTMGVALNLHADCKRPVDYKVVDTQDYEGLITKHEEGGYQVTEVEELLQTTSFWSGRCYRARVGFFFGELRDDLIMYIKYLRIQAIMIDKRVTGIDMGHSYCPDGPVYSFSADSLKLYRENGKAYLISHYDRVGGGLIPLRFVGVCYFEPAEEDTRPRKNREGKYELP